MDYVQVFFQGMTNLQIQVDGKHAAVEHEKVFAF